MPGIHPIIDAEETLTLAQAAARLPRVAGKVRSVASVRAWIAGTRAGGRVVRLEAVRVGRQWFTSAEAIGRFLAASSPAAAAAIQSASAARVAAEREKRSALALLDDIRRECRAS